jgi:hypothetical protein
MMGFPMLAEPLGKEHPSLLTLLNILLQHSQLIEFAAKLSRCSLD